MPRFRDEIMPIAAKQLLMAASPPCATWARRSRTSCTSSGASRRARSRGRGSSSPAPSSSSRPYFEYEKDVPLGRRRRRRRAGQGAEAGRRRRRLHQADRPGPAHRRRGARRSSRPRTRAASRWSRTRHREDEIRVGPQARRRLLRAHRPRHRARLSRGHPGRPAQAQQHALLVPDHRGALPRRLHRARRSPSASTTRAWQARHAPGRSPRDIRRSLAQRHRRSTTSRSPSAACPTLANKFRQLRETGVTHAGRHRQRHPRQLPHRLDLARAGHVGAARHDARCRRSPAPPAGRRGS